MTVRPQACSSWPRSYRRISWRIAVLAAVLASSSACVLHVPLARNYAGPVPRPDAAEMVDPVLAPLANDELRRDSARFAVRDLAIRGVSPERRVDFEYYDVEGDERKPIIVLLPIFNGQLSITRFFARYFANQGWGAIVIVRGRDALDGIAAPDDTIRANVDDYRRVLDWAEGQPEIDSTRIGLLGISFGAIDAVVLAALDDRIDALVTLMGGGDLSDVMVGTHYRPVARTVQDLADSEGITKDALRDELDARIETNPLELARYIDAGRVLMVLARTDVIVPFATQEALRESMGAPETLYLPTGHRPSVFYFPALRSRAYEFFARQFALVGVSVAAN